MFAAACVNGGSAQRGAFVREPAYPGVPIRLRAAPPPLAKAMPARAAEGWRRGTRFPNIVLSDADGTTRRLRDYRGDVVVLNFWASWCVPCVREMPVLQALHERHDGRGVHVLLVNMFEAFEDGRAWARDEGYDLPLFSAQAVGADASARPKSYRVMRRGDGAAVRYRPKAIPRTYILDGNGVITAVLGPDAGQPTFERSIKQARLGLPPRLARR